MPSTTEYLPISERVTPDNQSSVADLIRSAYSSQQAVYPLGGGTSLDYGLTPSSDGLGLDMTALTRVVEYAARDMTITVETGIRMSQLEEVLAGERQQLPIDVPRADEATLGGVITTNFSGPRRYGFGTLRDYVIGITAVDGRGVTFHGGGRVVKNVAGYDFCKMLIGSLGTLAVVTQVTLKVKPISSFRRWLVGRLTELDGVEEWLGSLVATNTAPTAIELLVGGTWARCPGLPPLPEGHLSLAVLFEGTPPEVDWQIDRLHQEWVALGMAARSMAVVNGVAADKLLAALKDFPDGGVDGGRVSPLVVKAAVPPSYVTGMVKQVLEVDTGAVVQCHAGNGIVIARMDQFEAANLTRLLVGKLQAAATRAGGSLTVLRSTIEGLTPQIIWGGRQASFGLMESVKRQFDPHNILNPGRFVFA
jgi:glycolate oxidase FAD binding subunit